MISQQYKEKREWRKSQLLKDGQEEENHVFFVLIKSMLLIIKISQNLNDILLTEAKFIQDGIPESALNINVKWLWLLNVRDLCA